MSAPYFALDARLDARWLLTCEHASAHLPAPWAWSPDERVLVGTHWAVDLGAEAITRALAARLQAPAVLAGFSRLLIDANRSPSSDTLFRTRCDDVELALNRDLSPTDRERRIRCFHEPYHDAIDTRIRLYERADLLSVHSFTKVYEGGPPRTLEVGVLFDHDEALAHGVAEVLRDEGLAVELNEPYSGRGGMMYSADRHAVASGRRGIEIEGRQDIASDPVRRAAVVDALVKAFIDA